MDIKIGCDPEFFLKKDGKFVSAFGMVEGTKANPLPVPNGAVQVDGMALEFISDAGTTSEEFLGNINSVMKNFRDIIAEEYEFVFSPVAEFGAEYIASQPPEAKILGCDPDYNAYTGLANPKPNGEVPFRTASGHIHIGWTENEDPLHPEHFEACRMLTKQLDHVLGIGEQFWDDDTVRKQMYGALGAFRPKPYGVEYRVLSNAWLRDDRLIEFIFDTVKLATEQLLDGETYYPPKSLAAPKFGVHDSYAYFKDRTTRTKVKHKAALVDSVFYPRYHTLRYGSVSMSIQKKAQEYMDAYGGSIDLWIDTARKELGEAV